MNVYRGRAHGVEEPDRRAIKLGHDLVQRAEMLVLADLHKRPPLRVAALANILMVSERALRKAFQDAYGVAPSRYLRRLRLSEARRALLSTQNVSVTEIATLFGFAELGRFSVEYRALFGESPSVTLRRQYNSSSTQQAAMPGLITNTNTAVFLAKTITGSTDSSEGKFAS